MSFWTKTLFIACRDCGLLHPTAGHTSGAADEEESVVAFREFWSCHRTHDIAWFRRHGSEAASDRVLWDPMATVTFEATDGQQVYVVSASRSTLDAPRTYRFVAGALGIVNAQILIDDRDLCRGLDLTFYPQALRLTKLERFVSLVHEVVSHLSPEELTLAFDDADDPAVSIACMPDETYQELLARCAEIFDASEFGTVLKFLQDNRYEDGLLALRVRRDLRAVPA